MRTKNAAHTLDNSILHKPLSIEPSPQTERNIDAIDIKVEHRPLEVFVRMPVLVSIVLFLVYRMVGGMIANVVTQSSGMNDLATFIKLVIGDLGPPCDIHVLERYARVLPFGHNSGLKDDSDARFRSEIVANRAGNRSYISSFSALHRYVKSEYKYLGDEGYLRLQTRPRRRLFYVEYNKY
jgi:hypothetical protein